MSPQPDPYAGMDADTIARMKASDDNARAITANRRRMAAALLAPAAPAQAVRNAWAAVTHRDRTRR